MLPAGCLACCHGMFSQAGNMQARSFYCMGHSRGWSQDQQCSQNGLGSVPTDLIHLQWLLILPTRWSCLCVLELFPVNLC